MWWEPPCIPPTFDLPKANAVPCSYPERTNFFNLTPKKHGNIGSDVFFCPQVYPTCRRFTSFLRVSTILAASFAGFPAAGFYSKSA
jgi:hypothetical protein